MLRSTMFAGLIGSCAASLASDCKSGLESLSGESDVELAARCRAAFPIHVCRQARTSLGAQPWSNERMEESCANFAASYSGMDLRALDNAVAAKSTNMDKSVAAKYTTTPKPPGPGEVIGHLLHKLKEAKDKKDREDAKHHRHPFGPLLGQGPITNGPFGQHGGGPPKGPLGALFGQHNQQPKGPLGGMGQHHQGPKGPMGQLFGPHNQQSKGPLGGMLGQHSQQSKGPLGGMGQHHQGPKGPMGQLFGQHNQQSKGPLGGMLGQHNQQSKGPMGGILGQHHQGQKGPMGGTLGKHGEETRKPGGYHSEEATKSPMGQGHGDKAGSQDDKPGPLGKLFEALKDAKEKKDAEAKHAATAHKPAGHAAKLLHKLKEAKQAMDRENAKHKHGKHAVKLYGQVDAPLPDERPEERGNSLKVLGVAAAATAVSFVLVVVRRARAVPAARDALNQQFFIVENDVE